MHEPQIESGKDPAALYKSRLGMRLFIAYASLYGLFVAINLVQPALMGIMVLPGINLAVTYGLVLILSALLLALWYDRLCRREETRLGNPPKSNTIRGED